VIDLKLRKIILVNSQVYTFRRDEKIVEDPEYIVCHADDVMEKINRSHIVSYIYEK